jgi:outer membrane receptor protein involved in Fe transport
VATTTTVSSASRRAGQRAPIDITLDAVKEFQVIATGAAAEFGRTAGGVVNVVTKSGTNQRSGSLFYFQRLEGLTGQPVRRHHAAGLFIVSSSAAPWAARSERDKSFYFAAIEGITGDFTRPEPQCAAWRSVSRCRTRRLGETRR